MHFLRGLICVFVFGYGTAAGDGAAILPTTDGGTTWGKHSVVSSYPYSLHGVSFSDANMGTVVGRRGTILRATDGGTTWVRQNIAAR